VSSDDGNDAGTVAFDATTGRRLWQATFGPARHDDYARGLALSPDGGTAYVVTSDIPIVPYTALTRLSVVAYDTGTGAVRWQSTLDPSPGDALSGSGVAADAGGVAVVGDVTHSANPLGDETQNVYDVLVAAFPA
jgi:outer membrane protein assembly factor BamB